MAKYVVTKPNASGDDGKKLAVGTSIEIKGAIPKRFANKVELADPVAAAEKKASAVKAAKKKPKKK